MKRAGWWLLVLLAVGTAGTALRAQEINWQEAVACLARECTVAETCVALLKVIDRTDALRDWLPRLAEVLENRGDRPRRPELADDPRRTTAVEMSLRIAGVPHGRGGAEAAMDFLAG